MYGGIHADIFHQIFLTLTVFYLALIVAHYILKICLLHEVWVSLPHTTLG